MSGEPLVVQAIYSFKGTNNDELCFKKGDKITITQKEDGGWWEGTLGGKTGWFPSNYVKECRDVSGPPPLTTITQQKQYREVVLKDVVDSEKAHVTELQGLVNNFLNPLEKSGILSPDEFQQLISNLYEIVDTHQQLLNTLEEELKLNHEARVGHIFLTRAPKIKSVHQTYCSLHPRAVCILDKYKDELTKFMESCNAAAPGILVLTTGLSKPFRRLDKYSGMLQELERHVEESHPDRGDTQRSVVVYKEIAATCEATRRQKELELQIVTGPVRGWEGQSLSTLGDIIYMGSVAIGPQHHDRYLVLFPSTLLMLSVSKRLSAFIYEGKLPLTGIVVTRLEDNDQFKNAFEINGPMIEKRIAVCQSRDEANHWVELLRKHMPNRSNSIHQKPLSTHVEVVQQPHLNQRGYSTRTSILIYSPQINFKPTYPPRNYPSAAPYAGLTEFYHKLIKSKIINKNVVKFLLYSEYNNVNLDGVKRRQHRTEFVIKPHSRKRDNIIKCSTDIDSDNSSKNCSNYSENKKISRQNAIDETSSSSDDDDDSNESNPFGYIRYYNPQTCSEQVRYESVIDYENISPPKKEIKLKSKPSIVLTSTANVQLIKQTSETSDASSCLLQKPFTGCEDLVNMDSSFEIDHNLQKPYFPTTRQSCPTKMVGNKFSSSSLTTIYIPTYQSNSENNISNINYNNENKKKSSCESESTTTTHSSSIDIPVNVAPLPDAMLAELLYSDKTESEIESDRTESTVIKPPVMFQNDERLSIQKTNANFRTHSINSDKPKPKRRSTIHLSGKDSNNLLRRCVSYKYLEMSSREDTRQSQTCCCCQSPRSSDSGMAGSCTLNSPDIAPHHEIEDTNSMDMSVLFEKYNRFSNPRNMLSLSEIEARTYESECQCTSPFGSTPRTSCQPSISGNTYSDSQHDSARTSVTSTSVELRNLTTPQWNNEDNKDLYKPKKSKSLTNMFEVQNVGLSVKENEEEAGKQKLYKSGLYAHWWMKAKIPIEVVKGIYEESATGKAITPGIDKRHEQSPRRPPEQ
nr:uncharacterized protein LOC111427702 isoform X1 [Onthophagus taurus]XP_022918712.1 uncharacterized protein LOC111427702 isoform X1 [Onthophagus taurus]